MASTPNGSVVDEINSGEDGSPPPKGSGRDDRGECVTSPTPGGYFGNRDQTGGVHSHGGYNPNFLGPPNPIDQLVAALHDAGLNTNPKCQKYHELDPDSDSDSDDGSRPKVRIPPQFSKDYQVKDLMHIR